MVQRKALGKTQSASLMEMRVLAASESKDLGSRKTREQKKHEMKSKQPVEGD